MVLGRIQAEEIRAEPDWTLPQNRKILGDALGMTIIPGQEKNLYEKALAQNNSAILNNATKNIKEGSMDRLPPTGYVKSLWENRGPIVRAIAPAVGRLWADSVKKEDERRTQQTIGQEALTELVVRPAKVLGFLAGGFSEAGKTMLEFVETGVRNRFQDPSKASLAAQEGVRGTPAQQALEEKMFGFKPQSYADYTVGILKFLDDQPEATPTEKKFLPLILPILMLGADLTPGGEGRSALTKAIVNVLDVREGAAIARTIGIREADALDVGRIFVGIKNDTEAEKYLTQLERTNQIAQAAKVTPVPLKPTPDARGGTILRDSLDEVVKVVDKEGKVTYERDAPPPGRIGVKEIQEGIAAQKKNIQPLKTPVVGRIAAQKVSSTRKEAPLDSPQVKAYVEQGIEPKVAQLFVKFGDLEVYGDFPLHKDIEEMLKEKVKIKDISGEKKPYTASFSKEADGKGVLELSSKGDVGEAVHEKVHAWVAYSPEFKEMGAIFQKDFDALKTSDERLQLIEKILETDKKNYGELTPDGLTEERYAYIAEMFGGGGLESIPPPLRKYYEPIFDGEKGTIGTPEKAALNKDIPATPKKETGHKYAEGKPRVNVKLEKMAAESPTFEAFARRAGVESQSLEATAKKKGFASAADFYDKHKSPLTETDSLDLMARQESEWQFALKSSDNEGDEVASNLESIFADLKGVEVEDLNFKFTREDLKEAALNYEMARETLLNDPARGLLKYVSKTTGRLPEVTGTETIKSLTGSGKDVPNSTFGRRGDDIVTEMGLKTPEDAQDALESFMAFRKQVQEIHEHLRTVRKDVQLKKQLGDFTEAAKRAAAREIVKDARALRNLVQAAEKAGYRKGILTGGRRYSELVARMKARRGQITAIKKRWNLTDAEMRDVRGTRDPRWMSKEDFDEYLKEIDDKAKVKHQEHMERLLIDYTIEDRNLNKTENLQRAMEFPHVNKMNLEQLREFSDILQKTAPGDTFLTSRMIQTAVNTDLGNIRTIGEGVEAIKKQTGMQYADPVEGSKGDRWLRDPALADRDPLHKLFVTEFSAREADRLSKEHQLNLKLTTMARAARSSRRAADSRLRTAGKMKTSIKERIFDRLAPQDKLVVRWLQPFETTYVTEGKKTRKVVTRIQQLRDEAEAAMTPQELEYAKFLENFFSHYYNLASQEAMTRWTLLGVKHSNYKSVYYLHMTRAFFERWRDDSLVKALRMIWSRDVAEVKVDFNAFGDRGEVLGYEKWLNQSMPRRGEGINKETGQVYYTLNTAKAARAYFHAFERKLILDAMTPKIKLLEFLMGKRFQTPKSISNPEGTEQVHSELRKHINEWINNKKGQRVGMIYEQGDRAEAVVDGIRLFIAIKMLGINLLAQVTSAAGGEVVNFAGLSIKGWAKGKLRSRALPFQETKARTLAKKYSGIIGDTPWNELASAANDAGDTLRSGVFYIFGTLSYRARRQMFLGLLTDEEYKTGVLSAKRQGDIKLEIGRWHPMPEFRSIAGSTSLVKAAGMFTEWAVPIMQNTHFVLLPRLRDMVRRTPASEWKTVVASKEFQTLFKMVVAGAGLTATAYLVLDPDQNDRSNIGYIRRKAAQEIGTILQSMIVTGPGGVPIPTAIFVGYLTQLIGAFWTLATLQRYKEAGPGYKEGDLKGPDALYKALVPTGIQQWTPEQETPLKTENDIRRDVREKLESGELSEGAVGEYISKELASLAEQQQKRRFALSEDEYRADVRKRMESGELTPEKAGEEIPAYLTEKKKRDPESFESDSDVSFIEKVQVYAEAVGTDPITAFDRIFTGQVIRRTDNGAIIVERMPYESSQAIKKARGAGSELILDHTIPLQLGGSNAESNLKLVPKEDWEQYTPVENYLGQLLRSDDITPAKARQLIRDFKNGVLTAAEVYAAAD